MYSTHYDCECLNGIYNSMCPPLCRPTIKKQPYQHSPLPSSFTALRCSLNPRKAMNSLFASSTTSEKVLSQRWIDFFPTRCKSSPLQKKRQNKSRFSLKMQDVQLWYWCSTDVGNNTADVGLSPLILLLSIKRSVNSSRADKEQRRTEKREKELERGGGQRETGPGLSQTNSSLSRPSLKPLSCFSFSPSLLPSILHSIASFYITLSCFFHFLHSIPLPSNLISLSVSIRPSEKQWCWDICDITLLCLLTLHTQGIVQNECGGHLSAPERWHSPCSAPPEVQSAHTIYHLQSYDTKNNFRTQKNFK